MKNIYNITKGQLITLWVFGGVGIYWAMQESCNWYKDCYNLFDSFKGVRETVSYVPDVAIFVIALALVFYTIGWRNNRKTNH